MAVDSSLAALNIEQNYMTYELGDNISNAFKLLGFFLVIPEG